jgi:hypothetical protein
MGCFWVYAAFCPLLASPDCDDEHVEIGGGTVAFESKNIETLSIFIKNLNSKFSPKFDSTIVARVPVRVFGGDVQRTEGAG